MKKLLKFTSLIELFLGIALVILPAEVLKLLFGTDETGSIIVLSRFTGIVFICFGIASFPSKESTDDNITPSIYRAMFLYNFLAAVYLGYMKFAEDFKGAFLLPAIIFHSLITLIFVFMSRRRSEN